MIKVKEGVIIDRRALRWRLLLSNTEELAYRQTISRCYKDLNKLHSLCSYRASLNLILIV